MITPPTVMLLGLGCILGVAGGIFQLGWPLVKKLADIVEAFAKNRRRSTARKGVVLDVGHKAAAAKRAGIAPRAAVVLFPSRPSARDSAGPGAPPSQRSTLRDPQSQPTSLHRSSHARPASPTWPETN